MNGEQPGDIVRGELQIRMSKVTIKELALLVGGEVTEDGTQVVYGPGGWRPYMVDMLLRRMKLRTIDLLFDTDGDWVNVHFYSDHPLTVSEDGLTLAEEV